MSGTTPTPGSEPGDENNPYAQPGDAKTPSGEPWAAGPAPADQPSASWEPSAGGPAGQPPEPPKPVRTAVKLMYVGAAIFGLYALLILATGDATRDAMRDYFEDTATNDVDVESMVDTAYGFTIGVFVLAVLLWLWMARSNKRGRSWARIVATVLAGLNVLYMLLTLTSGGLNLILGIVNIGLAGYILWLLFRPESGQYYTAVSNARR